MNRRKLTPHDQVSNRSMTHAELARCVVYAQVIFIRRCAVENHCD
jgi:hypothetical protein